MPNNWKKYTLGEIALQQKGAVISGPFGSNIGSKFFVPKGIPVIRGNNLPNDLRKFHDDGFVFITEEKAHELNCWALKNDILLTAAGTIGQIGLITGNEKYDRYIISNKQIRVRLDQEIVNALFVYYWLSTPFMNQFIKVRNTGSTIPLINLSVVKSLPISLPPLPEQQAIAEILSSLDDKIELNLQTNKTLEEMANALYKDWFIDFGPFKDGKFVESELGLIPEGWKVKELKENLSILKDGSHNPPKRTEEGVRFLAGATDIKHLTISFEKCSFISQEDYDQMHRKYHIQKDDILLTIVGTIGNVAIVRESDLPFSMQRSIAILRASDAFSNKYIYLLLNSLPFKHYMNTNINPTGQPGIYLGTLGSYKLVTPPINELKRFEKIVEPVFERMFQNVTENESLKQTRDYLLPKLISGEIRVKDVAKITSRPADTLLKGGNLKEVL